MKVGDKVKMSNRNTNHLGNGRCAYSGMEGVVTDVWEDGSFAMFCGNSTLVVPMKNAYGENRGTWIFLNGNLIFHRYIDKVKTVKKSLLRNILNLIK